MISLELMKGTFDKQHKNTAVAYIHPFFLLQKINRIIPFCLAYVFLDLDA